MYNGINYCFTGKKGSGKTLFSSLLINKLGYNRFSFAKKLKEVVCYLYNLDINSVDKKEYKEKSFGLEWNADYANRLEAFFNLPVNSLNASYKFLDTLRCALQYIGTDILRNYDVDFHINLVRNSYLNNVVFDDLRFYNEFEFLNENNFSFYYIINPCNNFTVDHESEFSLPPELFKKFIINNSYISLSDGCEKFISNLNKDIIVLDESKNISESYVDNLLLLKKDNSERLIAILKCFSESKNGFIEVSCYNKSNIELLKSNIKGFSDIYSEYNFSSNSNETYHTVKYKIRIHCLFFIEFLKSFNFYNADNFTKKKLFNIEEGIEKNVFSLLQEEEKWQKKLLIP